MTGASGAGRALWPYLLWLYTYYGAGRASGSAYVIRKGTTMGLLTMGLLTMAILTMAILTMGLLTMAVLTMAILTMAHVLRKGITSADPPGAVITCQVKVRVRVRVRVGVGVGVRVGVRVRG